MSTAKRVRILGVPVDAVTRAEAMDAFDGLMRESGCGLIITPNSEIVLNASKNHGFRSLMESAGLIIPDGVGLMYASKILKNPLPERVTGIDFLSDILQYLHESGKPAYFIGSKPGVAELAADNMKKRYPGLKVAGTRHGYFSAGEENGIVGDINRSGAEFLCAAMGSPKQEKFIYDHRDEFTNVRAAMGVGGSLDVWAGALKRAPEFYRKHGLEWLYRLFQEPSRFRRTLKLPIFLFKVIVSKK